MSTSNATGRPFTITGRTVLIGMFSFFGVVMAVNATFVYFALSTWPGLTTSQSYTEGLDYNQVLAAAKSQADRGWGAELSHGGNNIDTTFQVTLSSREGTPLVGLAAKLDLERPVGKETPRHIDLRETEPGVYQARIPRLETGRWNAVLRASTPGEPDFQLRYNIVVRP